MFRSSSYKGEQLIQASKKGDLDKIQRLLSEGIDINSRNKDGATILMRASYDGCLQVVKALLEKNADVNAHNKDGWTGLMLASAMGHADVVHALIGSQVKIDAQNKDGWSSLMIATYYGHFDVIKVLLETKSSVHAQNKDGETALMAGSYSGHLNCVKLLLEYGADITLKNNDRKTAQDIAQKRGHSDIVGILTKVHSFLIDVCQSLHLVEFLMLSFNTIFKQERELKTKLLIVQVHACIEGDIPSIFKITSFFILSFCFSRAELVIAIRLGRRVHFVLRLLNMMRIVASFRKVLILIHRMNIDAVLILYVPYA